ncbi:class I SAM-dependent methyltransferase [Methanophagales archaeon]|nr:MAG: class I SAM-dependent methyltransferase [Methanophagales archaeon]
MQYQFDGKKYEKTSHCQSEWGNELIAELNLKGNEAILDLGCGNGFTTKELAERVPHGKVVGIDSSSSMLEAAKAHKTANMELLLLDINEMAFDNEFDVVFSNAAHHWVLDHEKLLKNIYNALKPNGFMRIQFAGDGNCPNLIEVLREVMELPEFVTSFKRFIWPWYMIKPEEYEKLLSHTEFRNYKVWGENKDRYFSDDQSMIGWIEEPSIVPFLAVLPENLKMRVRDTVVGRMIERTKQRDGTYFETFRRINVYAEK